MDKKPIYDIISDKYSYNNMSNLNLLKPLVIWANTNSELDKFYKRPDINITDKTQYEKDLKNNMRHLTGLAITAKEYPANVARGLGYIKEVGDSFQELIKPKFGLMSEYFFDDMNTDLKNNNLGIDFSNNNPNATTEDIINYAYGIAKNKNNLYEQITK